MPVLIPVAILVLVATVVIVWWMRRTAPETDALLVACGGRFWLVTEDVLDDPVEVTAWAGKRLQSPLFLSPNREYVAYVAAADPPHPEGNAVWLADGNTLEERLIGPQPDDYPRTHYVHSAPTWSPDGARLAWVAYQQGAFLVVHDIATNETWTVIEDFPAAGLLNWGQEALAVYYRTETAFLFYDAAGEFLVSAPLAADTMRDFFWADVDGTEALVVVHAAGVVEVLDDAAMTWRPLRGELEMVVGTRHVSSVLRYRPSSQEWSVISPDGRRYPLDYWGHRRDGSITLASDGKTVVYVTDRVYWWRDGDARPVNIPAARGASVVWSPVRWRVV